MTFERNPCVYILASQPRGTLYIGVTSDLMGRLHQHREGITGGFTSKYRVHRLVRFEMFGDMESAGLLSFARPGYTLTLDFPNRGQATLDLLDRLDAITTGAGGAVNPYKDARMSPETFKRSFPGWERLEALRDPAFLSDFWRRTALEARISGGV